MSISKKQYEGFANFFEEPTRASLRELLKENIGETDNLDFKEEWPALPKVAKHILALVNSGGGALIMGIREEDDGTAASIGLKRLEDKANITSSIQKFIPSGCKWIILDFAYEDSEYAKIKGKKFQVLIVEHDPKIIPLLALRAGQDINNNVFYVRRGTCSTEATHNDLQRMINERVETGYSSRHVLELAEHLEQLKLLYRAKSEDAITLFAEAFEGNPLRGFRKWIETVIGLKKQRILEVLDVRKAS